MQRGPVELLLPLLPWLPVPLRLRLRLPLPLPPLLQGPSQLCLLVLLACC
jgi:hypothetical protein